MADDDQDGLAGAAADSGGEGVSTSGVGGEEVGTDPPFTEGPGAGGLDDVVEQARRTAWGPDERELNERD